jgi:hypothetical protein
LSGQVFASVPGNEVFCCFYKRGQDPAHFSSRSFLMVARADFIRTLLELALDVVKGGEVRCGGSRADPAPYLVDPVEDCDEGGGTCVREQQLRYRVAAQMGGNSSEVVRSSSSGFY